MKIRNTFIIFIVSGFWHGANWTFIVWGALNALYFLPLLLTNQNRKYLDVIAQDSMLPSLKEFGGMITTFVLTVLAWIFFRAENMSHALSYIAKIFSSSLFTMPSIREGISNSFTVIMLIILLLVVEWFGRRKQYAIQFDSFQSPKLVRWAAYFAIVLIIERYAVEPQEFIYFQF